MTTNLDRAISQKIQEHSIAIDTWKKAPLCPLTAKDPNLQQELNQLYPFYRNVRAQIIENLETKKSLFEKKQVLQQKGTWNKAHLAQIQAIFKILFKEIEKLKTQERILANRMKHLKINDDPIPILPNWWNQFN